MSRIQPTSTTFALNQDQILQRIIQFNEAIRRINEVTDDAQRNSVIASVWPNMRAVIVYQIQQDQYEDMTVPSISADAAAIKAWLSNVNNIPSSIRHQITRIT